MQLEQSEQQKLSLKEKINEMQQVLKDLEEKLVDSENSRQTEEEISKELQEQVCWGFLILLDYNTMCST